MRCAELLLVAPAGDRQAAALAERAGARGVTAEHVHVDGRSPARLTVGTSELQVNGGSLTRDTVLYTHAARYDVPALPAAAAADPALFQDHHIAQQQRASLLWSFLSAAEAVAGSDHMVNPWSRLSAIPSAFAALATMRGADLPVPPLLLTNSLRALRASAAHGRAAHVLWSFPDRGVPLRPLRRARWAELFRGNEIPLLILPPRTGAPLRAWVLHGRVLLVARVRVPAYEPGLDHLETFAYLPPDAAVEHIARAVHALFGLAFFELFLGETADGVRIEGLGPDPELADLPPRARAYLLDSLVQALAARAGHGDACVAPARRPGRRARALADPPGDPPTGEEERAAVYLTRLLQAPMALAEP